MKESLTENPRLLREDDGISPKMALELRTDPMIGIVIQRIRFPASFLQNAWLGCDGFTRYRDAL